MEQKKYSIIYADPPWRYNIKKGRGVAENHYSTMVIEDVCRLPICEIAEKDSVLFLWVTFPQLQEAFKVIKEWGFQYKTVAFLWIKQNRSGKGYFLGLGHWTRSNAEICLLAVKGKPKRISKKVFQLIISPLQEHSKKPAEARKRIVELMGDLPRIELFARQKYPGWDVWGDEVESSLDMEIMQENSGKEKPEENAACSG